MAAAAVAAAVAIAASPSRRPPTGCGDLARLTLPNTKIRLAEVVPAGDFTIDSLSRRLNPRPGGGGAAVTGLPAFCRITAEISPTMDSDIRIEVWMPATGWNGKFVGVGNGGWSGVVDYGELGAALRQGYAAAATNTGHDGTGDDARFALGHPEKVVDFGYRAVHEMTLKARALVTAFYGRPPERAYWAGCSTGGMQGLQEAQRFPLDYDAIVAGAPANYWTHLMAAGVWNAQATHASPASHIPRDLLVLIRKAALEACDADDGLKDGLIANPLRCHFDPAVLLCRTDDDTVCITEPQVEAARKIYAGPRERRTGAQIFPGLEPGSEGQWIVVAGPPEPPIVASYFKYLVFKDSSWDYRTLDFDHDVALADRLDAPILNATDPDLAPFIAHGGKLLLYHGWADGLIAPGNTVNYYNLGVKTMGSARARDAVRLFMVPGMGHCTGGPGDALGLFDALAALDRWVTTGSVPNKIVATYRSGPKVEHTRPLCRYPQIARYTGHGSTDDAANFVCREAEDR
jgi:feruloyl esterase